MKRGESRPPSEVRACAHSTHKGGHGHGEIGGGCANASSRPRHGQRPFVVATAVQGPGDEGQTDAPRASNSPRKPPGGLGCGARIGRSQVPSLNGDFMFWGPLLALGLCKYHVTEVLSQLSTRQDRHLGLLRLQVPQYTRLLLFQCLKHQQGIHASTS